MKTFLAKVNNGKLDFQSSFNEARFRDFCKYNEGKLLRIQRYEPIRSLSQNALYWAWLNKVEMETGSGSEDLHEYFKSKFLPMRLIRVRGKKGLHVVQTLGTTTKLTKKEFGEYIEKCAMHVGIPVPSKEELEEMGYISNT